MTARAALFAVALVAAALAAPARARASGCHEVSGVVGHERCTWFGTWSRDVDVWPLWLEIGYFSHEYRSDPFSLDDTTARTITGDPLATRAQGAVTRILAGRVLYGGVELEGGTLSTTPRALGKTQAGYAGDLEGHAIAGVHVALWRLGLGAELAAGGRAESLANCNAKTPGCHQVLVWETSRQLEARLQADVFVVPRFSIDVLVGRSLIDPRDTRFAISVGMHFRALDGAP